MHFRIFSSIILLFSAITFLTACHNPSDLKSDTVIPIPLHPTAITEQSQTEDATEALPPETESETAESETAAPAAPTEKANDKPPATNKLHRGDSGKTPPTNAAPQPSSTAPPTTEPPVTEPPATIPPVTEPPATEPPLPQPVETEPSKPDWYAPAIYDISNHSPGNQTYAIINEINRCRAESGLSALTLNTKLCAISHVRAYEVSLCWSHSRPDGRFCTTALSDYGYGFSSAAENLLAANGGTPANSIVALWMSSESHKANILSESFRNVGVGVYQANGNAYVACFFTN